jgi:hypothetical protein
MYDISTYNVMSDWHTGMTVMWLYKTASSNAEVQDTWVLDIQSKTKLEIAMISKHANATINDHQATNE